MIFKHNSLAVVGSIRAITEMPRTLPPRVPRVTLTEEMQRLVGKEGMHVLADGTKFHCTRRASHLLDARPWYDINFFKARTTLFQSVSGQWLQVENSADYINEPNPFTLASSQPKPRITMISSTPFSVEFFAEGGIPPKPSETLVRSYVPPRAPVTPEPVEAAVAAPRTPAESRPEPAEHQGEPAEHRAEPAEHQGEPAEHRGEPAERQGEPHVPQDAGDDRSGIPHGLEQDELETYVANNAAQQLQDLASAETAARWATQRRGSGQAQPDPCAVPALVRELRSNPEPG